MGNDGYNTKDFLMIRHGFVKDIWDEWFNLKDIHYFGITRYDVEEGVNAYYVEAYLYAEECESEKFISISNGYKTAKEAENHLKLMMMDQ